MKKLLYILAGTALLCAGCAKVENETNEVVPEKEAHTVILKATLAENTRVAADAAGVYSWQQGDVITVSIDGSDGFTTAPFRALSAGSTSDFEGAIVNGKLGPYAFYPHCDVPGHTVTVSNEGDVVKFGLGSEYDYKKDVTNMPMMGDITSEGVSFKAVGGLLKVIVYNVPEDAYKFYFTTDKTITGRFEVSETDGNRQINAASDDGQQNSIWFNLFEWDENENLVRLREQNMVFYIPLPVGTYSTFSFGFWGIKNPESADGGTPYEIVTKTATVNGGLTVHRNEIIITPSLNIGGKTVQDATLSNADILAADLPTSYPNDPISYTNGSGTWLIAGMKGGNFQSSGNWFVQIRNNAKLSYIQIPEFEDDIASITLKNVVNSNEEPYSSSNKVFFRSEANNGNDYIAVASRAEDESDITLTIPSGYKTGYIMSSNACLIESITIKFNGGTPATIPVISYNGNDSRTLSSGDLNCNITNVKLSNALDGNGISIIVDQETDWISTATISGDITSETGATVTVTASSYNHETNDRTGIIYLRATGAQQRVITITQKPSIVNRPTLSISEGNSTFSISWTGDSKVDTYEGYYSDTALDTPADGKLLTINANGSDYTATPSETVLNGTTYYVYVKAKTLKDSYVNKFIIEEGWATATATPVLPQTERTSSLTIANGSTFRTTSPAKRNDDQGFTWTLTSDLIGGWNNDYSGQQIGKSGSPCTATVSADYGDRTVSKVVVKASTGSSATLSVKVGETSFLCNGSESVSVTSGIGKAKWYTFEGTGSGVITITLAGGGSKASYYGGHKVTYKEAL